jgi:hypothetical protein|tara:strand:- start:185 stop:472 length:288 start_codon:yes stop_codon:yes gene_type:complete
MEIKNVLQTRAGTYGKYRDVSQISQDIKKVIKNSRNYPLMPAYMLESLELIANKLARILNGDPLYDDSWRDISGYCTLVLMEIEDMEKDKHELND